MKALLERRFHLSEHNTNLRTELLAGVTTFMTMAYIIFVQPAILSQAPGMDFNAVMMATCYSAALASIFMGLFANYPIALAAGMGENVFFTFTVVLGYKVPWQTALGIVLLSGLLFMFLNLFRIRQTLIDAIPESLKHAIAAGIGLFITFIGLAQAGLIVRNNNPLAELAFDKSLSSESVLKGLNIFKYAAAPVALGDLSHPAALLTLFGLAVILLLLVRRVKGAILWGMLATLIVALATGLIKPALPISAPPSIAPTFFQVDFLGVFDWGLMPIVLIFLFMAVFDAIGTLIGVGARAGLLREGKLPHASRALWVDATGTAAGSLLGTSTVTCYIESAAGVEAGGRTGLTAVFTGLLFLLAIFFSPLVRMIGGGIPAYPGSHLVLYPITAPALIIVGCLMIQSVARIRWSELTEAIPAFLTMIGMPFTYSIADGLAFGFITYPVVKLFSGKGKDVSWLVYLLGVIFLARYVFLKVK